MTRRFDRIEYNSGRARRFIIVPNDSSFKSDYVNKYGSDVVFNYANFSDAMSLCGDGRGDEILFAPGSYTLAGSTLTVNKSSVYIGSLSGNPYDVRIDASAAASADISVFTIAAAGDYTTIENLYITPDDSATQVAGIVVGGVGCVINNCTFIGADATAAIPVIDVNANDCQITNCRFYDFEQGIDLGAALRCVVRGCYFDSDNTAAKGVHCSGVCSWSIIDGNIFNLSGGTGDIGVEVDNTALRVVIANNLFHTDASDPILPGTQAGNDDTVIINNHLEGEDTADGSLIIT